MTDATPYTVPKERGRWRAITLAVLVHAALFAFLWIGVRWQSETPATIEAEVWSLDAREAAPPPPPVKQPEPEPVKAPEPAPVVKEVPKPVVQEPPVKNPDIALEQEKKRKIELEKKRQEEERQAKLKQKAEEERLAKQKQKAEEERLAKQKQKEEQERAAKQKAEEQRIAKEKAEKKKAAEEAKRKQEEAEQKKLDKIREQEMQRIAGGVTGTGGAGNAPKSQGGRADGGYAARVGAKIKSNITFNVPEGLVNNSPVEYEVDLLPDGSVTSIRKLKSSGVPGFDEAVRRAIEKSQPYPKDKSGSVPSSFIGAHKPKDQ